MMTLTLTNNITSYQALEGHDFLWVLVDGYWDDRGYWDDEKIWDDEDF